MSVECLGCAMINTQTYEGRSESSNNCPVIQLIFIAKQKETYQIQLQHVLYKCCENQDDAQRHNKNMFITKRRCMGTRSTPKSK